MVYMYVIMFFMYICHVTIWIDKLYVTLYVMLKYVVGIPACSSDHTAVGAAVAAAAVVVAAAAVVAAWCVAVRRV